MQQSTNSRSQEKAVTAELEDEQRLLGTVIRAHLDTCDFTKDKIEPMIARAREQPSYTACPPTLACPLNPNPRPLSGQQELLQDFSKRFSPAIRGVVEFAKRIPGFSLLPQDDQVTLLKAGVFEVLLVRLACMFDSQTNSMICLNGQVLKRESIHNSSNARFLMDSMFDFAERINSLGLSDAEIGLFCSVVVIAADRPGLRNTDLIERMHTKLRNSLQAVVTQNHPGQADICSELMKKIPDLRTLNTLHSEKLLAFKMTEQQQLQQQQLQQQEIWTDEETHSKSPAGSSWSSSSDVTMDEAVKSPLGSVSSTESVCSGEVAALTEHQGGAASTAPLLAATLAGGICPHRHRANSGSTSGDDDIMGSHLLQNGLTITAVTNPSKSYNQSHRFQRKLDSPSDSGIESGTEKIDKVTNSVNSAPTSLCSSPRSSLEDKDEDKQHTHIVEDMPVLKRVLQAPPLYDTNSLMDEAYKPHKKFRALRNKDSAEAEPMIVVSPVPSANSTEHHSSPQLHRHLTATTSAPPTLTGSHPALSSSLVSPLSSSHSTLVSTLTSSSQSLGSSLSSTHSTLAKSLMEGPRMTAEQVKRQEIIHNYIMRGDPSAGDFPSSGSCPAPRPNNSLLNCGGSQPTQTGYHYLPTQPQPSRWHSNGASVITTSRPFSLAPNSTSSPPPVLQKALEQPSAEFSRIYLQPQSPHLASSSTSPSPLARNSSPSSCSPMARSPSLGVAQMGRSSPKLMELQVDIADSNQQPLNLSKKSPSPSPRPLSAPSTAVQKALTLEA
ncbi:hypothetical protein RUM43_005865 [Polyplax serrata]|uniref:NR LBD domain-containing protein n=1 Tax=Polyplax serrata TaxID=468196 RepID=A0AAN8PXT6_POLSC